MFRTITASFAAACAALAAASASRTRAAASFASAARTRQYCSGGTGLPRPPGFTPAAARRSHCSHFACWAAISRATFASASATAVPAGG